MEALVDSAADKDQSVRESIYKSVIDIGRKKYVQVLDILHTYLSKHNKVGVANLDSRLQNSSYNDSWLEVIVSSFSN